MSAQFVIRFEVDEVSKLDDKNRASPIYHHADMPWSVQVRKHTADAVSHLAAFIHCNDDSGCGLWTVEHTSSVVLVNRNNAATSTKHEITDKFTKATHSLGKQDLILFTDLVDATKGFILEDKVIVEAHITVKTVDGIKKIINYDFTKEGRGTVALTIAGEQMHVSKGFLAVESPFFADLFYAEDDFKEKEQFDAGVEVEVEVEEEVKTEVNQPIENPETETKDTEMKDATATSDTEVKEEVAQVETEKKDSTAEEDAEMKDPAAAADNEVKDSTEEKESKDKDDSTAEADSEMKDSTAPADTENKDSTEEVVDTEMKDASDQSETEKKDSTIDPEPEIKDDAKEDDTKDSTVPPVAKEEESAAKPTSLMSDKPKMTVKKLVKNDLFSMVMKDVSVKDFTELLMATYPSNKYITVESYKTILALGARFQVQRALDKVEQYLIKSEKMTVSAKLLLSEQHKLDMLKLHCLYSLDTPAAVKALETTTEYKEFSDDMKVVLLHRVFALIK